MCLDYFMDMLSQLGNRMGNKKKAQAIQLVAYCTGTKKEMVDLDMLICKSNTVT